LIQYEHQPVLAASVIEGLHIRRDGIDVDGTLGGGGHASMIASALSVSGTLIGIDRDREALEAATARLSGSACNLVFRKGNFADLPAILKETGIAHVDGALLDLGVSSYQLDNPARGFSYMREAPLDMRMDGEEALDETRALTAERVVNEYDAKTLSRILWAYGEERWASRIATFIVNARKVSRITTTGRLTEVIKAAIPASARREGPHPAKRAFQAIRIEVNGELERLEAAIESFVDALSPGGRLAVISFHSLEDRIVKEVFKKRERPCICPPGLPTCVCGRKPDAVRINKKPIVADSGERAENPRSRSAKLRILEKI
jgi:16S rRNA (cytosine1402-N4)-methyltransferase